jgi:UDP-2,4-diacetamido-2,4,6-trideoxy-beta-L-altropyranose hydrolase
MFNPSEKTACFRCDASSELGAGHVMRSLSLAKALKEQGWHCCFIASESSSVMVPELKNFDVVADTDGILDDVDLLIIDHYHLDKNYELKARNWAKKILVIDDLANRLHDCDILLDQTMGRDINDYKNLVPENCHILCGSEFTLLRPQFLNSIEQAKIKREKVARVQNILINFGATNPQQIIQKTLSALSSFKGRALSIDVIMSSKAAGCEDVLKLCKKTSKETVHQVTLETDVIDMASFMLKADMAIGAGGTTSWERACLGLPTLLIEVSEDQRLVSENLHKLGAVYRIGNLGMIGGQDIDNAFENMRDNADLLRKMSEIAFTVCDGKGTDRLCKIIQKMPL